MPIVITTYNGNMPLRRMSPALMNLATASTTLHLHSILGAVSLAPQPVLVGTPDRAPPPILVCHNELLQFAATLAVPTLLLVIVLTIALSRLENVPVSP